MNYQSFLERGDRWRRFEDRLDALDRELGAGRWRRSPTHDLDHLALEEIVLEYRRVLSDYALANARFPDTWAARHLGQLVARANHRLRTDVETKSRSVVSFYRSTLPSLFRAISSEIMVCVALFLVAVLLGGALATISPDSGKAFLPAEALAGMERGQLWTDEIEGRNSFVSALIARNNMKVAMAAWAGGLLAGVGSLVIVFFNGLMLGVILATTLHYAMHTAVLGFIAAHGPLELTLILVAGAAGLHMGRALVEDGDLPRTRRLAVAAKTSVFVLLGCLPFFVLLGLVEGFVSPAPGLGTSLKVVVGLALEALFLAVVLRPVDRGGLVANSREPGRSLAEGA